MGEIKNPTVAPHADSFGRCLTAANREPQESRSDG